MKNFRRIVALLTVLALCMGICLSMASCKPKHEHTWDAGTVTKEATCLAVGTKTFKCSCGETKTEDIPRLSGHVYKWGKCAYCGDKAIKDEKNFYFALAESLTELDKLYVNLSGLKIAINEYEVTNADYENKVLIGNSNIELEVLHLMVTVDENGNLVGKGEGKATMTSGTGDFAGSGVARMTADAALVIENGKIYISLSVGDGKTGDEGEFCVDLNKLLYDGDLGEFAEALPMLEALYAEGLDDILAGIKATPSNPINAAMATVMEYVFTKEATANGYVFTLNFDRVIDVYDAMNNKTVAELYDAIFGEGTLVDTANWAKSTWNKDFAEVEVELRELCAEMGVNLSDVYAYINTVANSVNGGDSTDPDYKAFDVEDLLKELRGTKVCDYLNGMAGEENKITEEEFIEEIDALLKRFNENTLIDLMGGSADQLEPNAPSDDNPSPMSQTTEEDSARAQLETIVEQLKKLVNVSFTTDKNGAFVSLEVKLDIKDMHLGKSLGSDENKTYETTLSLNGTLTVNTTGTVNKNFDDVVESVENKINAVVFNEGDVIKDIDTNEDKYVIVEYNGELYIVPTFTERDFYREYEDSYEEVKIDGVLCTKYTYYTYNYYSSIIIAVDNISQYSITSNCNGYIDYSIISQFGNYAAPYYTVYVAGEEIVKVELDTERTFEEYQQRNYSQTINLTYSIAEGKFYSHADMHDYERDSSDSSTYTCTICGKGGFGIGIVGDDDSQVPEFDNNAPESSEE